MVQFGSLVKEIQNFEENLCLFFYDINLFERYDQYEKMFIGKTILISDFTSVYQIWSKSVHLVKIWKF